MIIALVSMLTSWKLLGRIISSCVFFAYFKIIQFKDLVMGEWIILKCRINVVA